MLSVVDDNLRMMRNAAERFKARSEDYRKAEVMGDVGTSRFTRITVPLKGQLDYDGLTLVLPMDASGKNKDMLDVLYEHCYKAIKYVGKVEESEYKGFAVLRVRAANLHNVTHLERRLMYYPHRLAAARVVPSFDISYTPSSAIPRKARGPHGIQSQAQTLLAYAIEKGGFKIRQAARDLGMDTDRVRYHARNLRGQELLEHEGKPGYELTYMPLVDEVPSDKTTRSRILDYAMEHGTIRTRNLTRTLKITDSLFYHHAKRLMKLGALKKEKKGVYSYTEKRKSRQLSHIAGGGT